ncbi:MAG: selenium cofactor biosynthesis protein YqeC [Wenzhouxiangella sp.]
MTEALGIGGGIVAAIGAGGKKSVMNALSSEAKGRLAWTGTVFTARPPRWTDVAVHVGEEDELLEKAAKRSGPQRQAFLRPSDKPGRYAGLAPETIARLHQIGGFDLTLVKADGARMRGLKCPKPGEPVLPPHTDRLVLVVSARVIGRPLDPEFVHRPERVGEVLGLRLGQTITAEHLGQILAHPQGLQAGTEGRAILAVVNQVDDAQLRELAERAARQALALSDRFERVVLSCLQRQSSRASVVSIVERSGASACP